MSRLKALLLTFSVLFAGFGFALAPAQPVQAAPCTGTSALFGLPTWYKYLECDADGKTISADINQNPNQLWLIGAAILEIMTRVAALAAVGFVMYGGFRYLTSAGNPDKTAQARKSIINALIGLSIAIISTAAISFLATEISGGSGGGLTNVAADETALQRGLNIVYTVAGIIAALMIVIGGFKFVTANSDPGKISSARQTLVYALIGMGVVLFAAALTSLILSQA